MGSKDTALTAEPMGQPSVVTLYYTTSTRLYSEKRTAVNRATVKTE